MKEDLSLIKQLQQKDTKALSLLYDHYAPALNGVIIRVCKDEVLAEELLQETFMKIWEKATLYDPKKGRFYTWAYRIAKNTALNGIRNSKKLIQTEDLGVYTEKAATEPASDYTALKGSIHQLDQHHQEAIELVYFKGLTHREAHQEMGVPLGTFKSYVSQALKKLRATYQKQLMLLICLIEMVGS